MSEADFFKETPTESEPTNTAEELTEEYQDTLEGLRKGIGATISNTTESVETQQNQREGLVSALESLQEGSPSGLRNKLIQSIQTGKETE